MEPHVQTAPAPYGAYTSYEDSQSQVAATTMLDDGTQVTTEVTTQADEPYGQPYGPAYGDGATYATAFPEGQVILDAPPKIEARDPEIISSPSVLATLAFVAMMLAIFFLGWEAPRTANQLGVALFEAMDAVF